MPALHEHYPELAGTLPYVQLGDSPTPVRELPELAGRNPLWVKDESGYGSGGWGGNKVRKLEWLIPDALRNGARTILTVGGLGTNWGLACALYARERGLHTALALLDQPVDDHVRAQLERLRACGATLHFTHSKARTVLAVPWLFLRHSTGLRPPYLLPAGGSSPVGALGYVETAFELAAQVHAGELPEPAHLVAAVGSGGTVAGLALGLRLAGLHTRVVGAVVNDALLLDAPVIARLANRCAEVLRTRGARLPKLELLPEDVTMEYGWLGPGYGHATPEAVHAQGLGADAGLRLEPVYTAKALAAARALDAEGRLGDGPVLFLNTYGPR